MGDKRGEGLWSWGQGRVEGSTKEDGAEIKGYDNDHTGYMVWNSEGTHHYVEDDKTGEVTHHDEK